MIPTAFLLLTALLLWVLIGARGKWWVKLTLMALTLFVGCGIIFSLRSYLGRPRPAALVDMGGQTAWLFWLVVDEPGERDPGKISMWMNLKYDLASGPFGDGTAGLKVYEFPYSRDFHEVVQKFLTQLLTGAGRPIQISFAKRSSSAPGGAGNQMTEHGLGAVTTDVFVLPEPKLPEKRP